MGRTPLVYNPAKQPCEPRPGQLVKIRTGYSVRGRNYMLLVFGTMEGAHIHTPCGINLAGEFSRGLGTLDSVFEPLTPEDMLEMSRFLMRQGMIYNYKKKQLIDKFNKDILYSWN